jgi:predicted dehydrogenase
MRHIKIIGAGSIGNHLANAARSLDWKVDLCDRDQAALERTRGSIYPKRYGAWDDAISLYSIEDAPIGVHDAIFIGTPPDAHMAIAMEAVASGANLVHVEKPVCTPELELADALIADADAKGVYLTVGYDLLLGDAFLRMEALLRDLPIGPIKTIDVETREHWGGIFGAHPWLDGPKDSYLGFWHRGGGATGEHSHGLNMWQHLAHVAGAGRIIEISASADYVRKAPLDYDQIMLMNLRTETGLLGRCVQDVVTQPARKWARIQGENGFVEWEYLGTPGHHVVRYGVDGEAGEEEVFVARRTDDFLAEVRHIGELLDGKVEASPIDLRRGLDTMLLITGAHRSAASGKAVTIDYGRGYVPEALG